jgi:hypothetical protein
LRDSDAPAEAKVVWLGPARKCRANAVEPGVSSKAVRRLV